MSNVLVTGSKGQLGSEINYIQENFPVYNFFFTDVAELDITGSLIVEEFIVANKIEVIINCAAYTNVDGAEDAIELANLINNVAAKNLAEIAKKHLIKLVHVSTDYVFDGDSSKPYVETDLVNPINVYGKTKLKGEQALISINPTNTIIIRTAWLYSEFGNNFVKTILRLSDEKDKLTVVDDQVGSPTYAKDLASCILQMLPQINNASVEVYHYSNKGTCSWFEFAKAIVNLSNHQCEVLPVSSKEFKSKAKRPNYSLLNTEKIENTFHMKIPFWKDSLKQCILSLNK